MTKREIANKLLNMYSPHLGVGIINLQFEEDITDALEAVTADDWANILEYEFKEGDK